MTFNWEKMKYLANLWETNFTDSGLHYKKLSADYDQGWGEKSKEYKWNYLRYIFQLQ